MARLSAILTCYFNSFNHPPCRFASLPTPASFRHGPTVAPAVTGCREGLAERRLRVFRLLTRLSTLRDSPRNVAHPKRRGSGAAVLFANRHRHQKRDRGSWTKPAPTGGVGEGGMAAIASMDFYLSQRSYISVIIFKRRRFK